jgi:uncharacterized phiE125 gp8 family phage protein
MDNRQALIVTTQPTEEPITLKELKDFAKIEYDNEDDDLESIIIEGRTWAEDETHRTFVTTRYLLYLDGFADEMELPSPPLVSVESIKYVDIAGIEQTLDPSLYLVIPAGLVGRVVPAHGKSWPSTQDIPQAVRIAFTAGYGTAADVPANLKRAIKYYGKAVFDDRDDPKNGILTARSLLEKYVVPMA